MYLYNFFVVLIEIDVILVFCHLLLPVQVGCLGHVPRALKFQKHLLHLWAPQWKSWMCSSQDPQIQNHWVMPTQWLETLQVNLVPYLSLFLLVKQNIKYTCLDSSCWVLWSLFHAEVYHWLTRHLLKLWSIYIYCFLPIYYNKLFRVYINWFLPFGFTIVDAIKMLPLSLKSELYLKLIPYLVSYIVIIY